MGHHHHGTAPLADRRRQPQAGRRGDPGKRSTTAVGLANVDNTADANKPVSGLTEAALNLKAPLAGQPR